VRRPSKRTEEALRDSEERFKDFADAASDWYWEQDADLRFTSASPSEAYKKTGATVAELVGKTRRDIVSLGVTEEQWRRHDADLAARRPFRDFTFQRRDPSGELRDFSLDGMPVFDAEGRFKGYRGVGRDITERKRAEATLHRLGMAIEAVSEMIILYDAEDRLIHFNEAFREMNREVEKSITPGMTAEEVMRTMIAKGLLPEAAGREEAWLRERLERHKNPGDPVEIARQDGIWLLTHEQRLPDGGTIIISQNITERKRAEEQVRTLNAELEQRVEARTAELRAAQEQLLRKSRLAALGQLTGTVSHELRNPLGALRIAIAAVDKMLPEAPPALARTLAIANRSVSRCDEIITDLLEYSRARALDRSDVALDGWLSGILDEIEVPAGVTVSHALDCGLALAIDPERLWRAVLNVVENACQAMTPEDDDAAPAEDSDRRLSVATRTTGARVEIRVRDTGPGIDEATLAKVFEPLFSTKAFGVGLGMTVVEQIMEQHGGGIEIDSAPGRGTEVVLWLPLPEPARRAAS
jgi:PAS domain S-box-containing protein